MQLARVFSNYMVLQRNKPVLIWGRSEKEQKLPIKINGAGIPAKPFSMEAGGAKKFLTGCYNRKV